MNFSSRAILVSVFASLGIHVFLIGVPEGVSHLLDRTSTPRVTYTFELDPSVPEWVVGQPNVQPPLSSLILVSEKKQLFRLGSLFFPRKNERKPKLIQGELKPVVAAEQVDLSNVQKKRIFLNYYEMICLRIKEKATYPDEAKVQQLEGISYLSFLLRPNGSIESLSVRLGSGQVILDRAALHAVKSAAPFPPFPKILSQGPIRLNIPIAFQLQEKEQKKS